MKEKNVQDIPEILRSLESLDRVGRVKEELADDTSPEDSKHSIQGPNGEYYHPIPVTTSSANETGGEPAVLSDDVYERGACGIGVCRPRWTQCLANLNVFVIIYGISGIWIMALSSLLGSQVTSIERHLGVSSSKTGLLLSSNEIGYLVAVIIGSHFGKYTHIPRCLSASGVVFGLATIAMSFGRLMEPRVWQDNTGTDQQVNMTSSQSTSSRYLCELDLSISQDTSTISTNDFTTSSLGLSTGYHESAIPWAFWLLMVASMIGGAVKSYRLPLLTFYIETNIVNKERSAFLLGTSITAMILGPPIAMFIGGYISSLPVDLKETSMSSNDLRWVGAWWLGFVITGLACTVCSLPIMFFPNHMGMKKVPDVKDPGNDKSLRVMLLDLPKSLGRIFRQPIFVLTLVFACLEGLAFSGWFAFSQKYVETQFNKTPQEVSIITGALCVFALVIGTFAGGVFTTKQKLDIRGCAVVTFVITCVTVFLDCLYLLFGCKNSDVAGMAGSRTPLMDSCGCKDDIFLVCGDDNVNYLSPCLAGCTNTTGMIYTNCTGINNGGARPGLCDLECNFFVPYLIVFFIGCTLGTFSIIPSFMLTVRSVEQRDQSLASGTASFCQTVIGILPSPMLFGRIIDSACSLWSPGGSCLLYDRERFRYVYEGVSLGLRFISILVLALLLWIACRQKRREGSKDENKKAVKT